MTHSPFLRTVLLNRLASRSPDRPIRHHGPRPVAVLHILLFCLLSAGVVGAQTSKMRPLKRPSSLKPISQVKSLKPVGRTGKKQPSALVLQKGDRLLMVGDSITVNNKYSLLVNLYLSACRPDLEVHCMQSAISGETTEKFLVRSKQAIKLCRPTIATTCFGMNDGGYGEFNGKLGTAYKGNTGRMANHFMSRDCRVILGAPGITGPSYADEVAYNQTLGKLADIAQGVALQRGCTFANVRQAMVDARDRMTAARGEPYDLTGRDGVHSDWQGQMAMAIAFLKAMGLEADGVGRIDIDLKRDKSNASPGHRVLSVTDNIIELESSRYPFLFHKAHNTPALADMWQVAEVLGFFDGLNRFTLSIQTARPGDYELKWDGAGKKVYDSKTLAAGINLASEFANTPFIVRTSDMWQAISIKLTIDNAIAIDQRYERTSLADMGDWLKKVLLKVPDGDRDLAELARSDPMAIHDLAERNLKMLHEPVPHTIKLRRL